MQRNRTAAAARLSRGKGGFVQTPNWIVRDGTLSPEAKVMLEIYKSYSRQGWISIPMPRLMVETGVGENVVDHARQELIKRHLLLRRQKSFGRGKFGPVQYQVTPQAYPPRSSASAATAVRQYLDGFAGPKTEEEMRQACDALERELAKSRAETVP